ncbi:uncharacterized protein MONOS_16156 [Monocercomonoides exilis]|uniref:uncharacterized protein n=1 Tax=Monocercomonoides exilis TaxID=2049356 RepID=UPI00355A5F8A|nr:hypothetical protein MONOS_16156 [Monocercomonoides exilis]|eukprot:MONOS_16156.1-p1 / transcript=MONOS_16156.1 / gene=MONOS_16156 / organism=Monocercomonoides_exilis_PA203 / gene_product=unspecified product / transcript_product=unspecified product / location=Mono_scaffold01533:870-1130(-) / protein_length=87 / sequence_SO=supercontig / SO=protein_coding / is_pseudo=false
MVAESEQFCKIHENSLSWDPLLTCAAPPSRPAVEFSKMHFSTVALFDKSMPIDPPHELYELFKKSVQEIIECFTEKKQIAPHKQFV